MSNWFCEKKQHEIPYKMAKGCRRCRVRKEKGWKREWCEHLKYKPKGLIKGGDCNGQGCNCEQGN